ncbi:MAG: 30S ribosomal protein S16 [Deltaproteobacteria bacterium]|nr:30S ribosomal protein S16 [Deltaproteobacteria bacterium]
MVRIRLARHGSKKRPFYRIVASYIESRRDGRFLEILGTYDPRLETNQVQLKSDRVQYWLEHGAKPSETVGKLLKQNLQKAA